MAIVRYSEAIGHGLVHGFVLLRRGKRVKGKKMENKESNFFVRPTLLQVSR